MRSLWFATAAVLLLPGITRAQDTDLDGAADVIDVAPCDPALAGQAFLPAEGAPGTLLFEDQWPDIGDGDFNDLVLAYHYEVSLDAQGRAVRVVATYEALAIGGDYVNGLGVHLPIARDAATAVSVQVGGGAPVAAIPSATDAELTFTVLDDLRTVYGGAQGPINVTGPAQSSPQIRVQVDLTPTALDLTQSPFDVYIFRSADPGHEVHRDGYAGTSAMHTGLFQTGSDASGAGRTFVDGRNLPFVLHLPDAVVYPAEGNPIEVVFPRVVSFASSAGQQDADFYVGDVVTSQAYASAPSAAAVSTGAPAISCLPATCLAAQSAGASTDGQYMIAPDGLEAFEVYCDMTHHGGGWTLYSSSLLNTTSSAGPVTRGLPGYMPSARIKAIADQSTQVYLRTADNFSRYILSVANRSPIQQLRNLRSLSKNPNYSSADWTGPMINQMWYTCGSVHPYPYIYWACNNTSGLHLGSGGGGRWVYSGGYESFELFVR